MTIHSLALYVRIMRHFRNFPELIRVVKKGGTLKSACLWNGLRFSHPPARDGLTSVLVETWVEETYTGGGFYSPKPGDVVFDIGANVGVFAIYLAHKNSRCRIFALEPFPENFEYLQRNIDDNRICNVEPQRLALGAQALAAYMLSVGNRSLDHVLRDRPGNGTAFQVETCSLAELLDRTRVDRVALLKMDIEGSEKDVFEQVELSTLRRFERIALEYHDNLRPGTLTLIRNRLGATHLLEVKPSTVEGCGVIRASLSDLHIVS